MIENHFLLNSYRFWKKEMQRFYIHGAKHLIFKTLNFLFGFGKQLMILSRSGLRGLRTNPMSLLHLSKPKFYPPGGVEDRDPGLLTGGKVTPRPSPLPTAIPASPPPCQLANGLTPPQALLHIDLRNTPDEIILSNHTWGSLWLTWVLSCIVFSVCLIMLELGF